MFEPSAGRLQGALSNDVSMSPRKDSERRSNATPNGRGAAADDAEGVLSKLPRTRPQRSSARRVAARDAATAAKPTAKPATTAQRPRSAAGRAARTASARVEPAPRQGFECEGERNNRPVHPPGGAELVASAAEIVSELARAGLSTGERLIKDALSRLPLS